MNELKAQKQKTDYCLNCDYQFRENENYCPKCGQENDIKRKTVGSFLKEFIEDLVSIDSRLYRSIPVFLFKPGKLTVDYNEGRRRKYITPIRLYLTWSFVCFLAFSFKYQNELIFVFNPTDRELVLTKKDSIQQSPNKKRRNVDILKQRADSIQKARKESSEPLLFWGVDVEKVQRLSKQKGINENSVIDSLKITPTLLQRMVIRQWIRLENASEKDVVLNFFRNLPLMFFFLLPAFALILKLFYIRRKIFYVEHLIFMLHLHSFFFFILSIMIFVQDIHPTAMKNVNLFFLLLLFFYTYKSFRVVYKQSRFKTFLKLLLLSFGYIIILSLTLVLGVGLSLLFF